MMESLKGIFKDYQRLPKSIFFLFIARTINSMGDFVFPMLTMFLTQILNLGEEKAGLYFMTASAIAVPGTLIGGILSDRVGRKATVIIPQFFSTCCIFGCCFLGKSIYVPVLLIISVFLINITRPAFNAIIVDLTTTENRKNAFTLFYLGVNIGICIGPMLAGVFFNTHIEWVFLGMGVTLLVSFIIIFLCIPETNPYNHKRTIHMPDGLSDKEYKEYSFFKTLIQRPFLLAFICISILNYFIYIQYSFSMPIYSNIVFSNSGAKIFGSLMTVNALGVIFITPVIMKITSRIEPILNIALGGLFYAVGFGMLFMANNYFLFAVSTLIWTIGEILIQPNLNVYIANHCPTYYRGRFNAILPFISVIGYALGPSIMGVCMKLYGVKMVWPILFLLGIVFSVALYLLYKIERKILQQKALLYNHKQEVES